MSELTLDYIAGIFSVHKRCLLNILSSYLIIILIKAL